MLREIGKKFGKKVYEILRDLIRDLEFDPRKKGQTLHRPLNGYYSLHYSRFRVVYSVNDQAAEVLVIAAGHHESGSRRDIYRIVEHLVNTGLIELKSKTRKIG